MNRLSERSRCRWSRVSAWLYGSAIVAMIASPAPGQSESLVTVTATVDVQESHPDELFEVTVPLSEPVAVDGLSYVLIEAWELEGFRFGATTSSWGGLTSARLLDADGDSLVFAPGQPIANVGTSLELTTRCYDVLGSATPTGFATSVQLRVEYGSDAGTAYQTVMRGLHAGNQLRVHFAYGGIGPGGAHAQHGFNASHPPFTGISTPWQNVFLTSPLPAVGLRLVATEWFSFLASPPVEFTTHVQVMLDDATFLTLDDHSAPSGLGFSPTPNSTNSLLLDDSTTLGLLDKNILGIRWRFQLGPNTLAGEVPQHINRVRFLFDFELPIRDCNANGIPDEYDPDLDGDGQPDDCQPFVRGFCNADGAFDLGDAVFLLSAVFGLGPQPDCRDACDMNDDGSLNIADPIEALTVLFGGGVLAEPTVACGEDPTSDGLDCVEFACP